jgi:8-oxo-dGTP pyrophosphatase MutT (NUDIX family)
MTLLRHIAACNRFDPDEFAPFAIGGESIGRVRRPVADFLRRKALAASRGEGVEIEGGDPNMVSEHLARIVAALAGEGLMAPLRGEATPVRPRWDAADMATIDRAGLPGLGLPAFGVHVNGFVRRQDGLHLWIGRRAQDRQVAPGKLDHLVAGGVPAGLTIRQTLVKEAEEEAGLDAAVVSRAAPVGAISYRLALPEGLRNDTLFIFDLEIPPEVAPANQDGEMDSFALWPVSDVIGRVRETDDFKFNVNLVIIDFLVRHGQLDPDFEPDYIQIVRGLRR